MIRDNDTILLADRRTSHQGRVITDEHNKVTVLFCNDAKMAIAFTGVATFGDFITSDWLASTLAASGTQETSILKIIEAVRVSLSTKMRTLGAAYNQLTLLCAGYVYWTDAPEARIYEITNVASDGSTLDDATVRVLSPDQNNAPTVELAGNVRTVPAATLDRLKALLQRPLPAQDVLRFAVAHLRNAANSSSAFNSIGEQCNSVVLERPVDTQVTSTYHSAHNTYSAYTANVVVVGHGEFLDSLMTGPDVLAGPVIRAKDSCWCGSGVSFGRCHLKKFGSTYARMSPFKSPLPMYVRVWRDTPWPSGSAFLVCSSFV